MIASCVSPTDPILAQAVVGGPWAEKHVPAHIRHMLQCESGCNDGAAFPFLYLAYYLTVNRGQVGFPVGKWFYRTYANSNFFRDNPLRSMFLMRCKSNIRLFWGLLLESLLDIWRES